MSSQLRYVSTIGKKNLLSSNISLRCPDNMVNFGPLTAEVCWQVWGTPSYFNGYHVLAALLHGSQVVGVSQTLRSCTEGATSVRQGNPSRWALAHILVSSSFTDELRCWRGYLSAARCKRFAHDPADASATPSSLASFKSRLVLPVWCQLTQVVMEKRLLNGCF